MSSGGIIRLLLRFFLCKSGGMLRIIIKSILLRICMGMNVWVIFWEFFLICNSSFGRWL